MGKIKNEEFVGKGKTIAILGYGGRGKHYAGLCKYVCRGIKVIAVIDNNPEKLAVAKANNNLDDKQLFANLEDFLNAEIKADYVAVCTQDADHIKHAIPLLEKGYNLLLEKPIACSAEDCVKIEQTAKKYGREVVVCHVLRYSNYYGKLKEIIDSGVLGKIISVEQEENVAYWHMAHSYVRGDWRRKEDSTPIVLAKTCHDLDIAVYLIDSKCESVTSTGGLTFFNKENAPEGATEYCVGGCKAKESCPYDCEKLYINPLLKKPAVAIKGMWPQSRLMSDGVVTIPKLREAIKTTRYGKCVFLSDNDVADHQVTTMVFKNGVISTLIMSAFSNKCFRETRIRGTFGEVVANMGTSKITMEIYGKKPKKMRLMTLDAHGGGDSRLVWAIAKNETRSDISKSIESHLIGFAAEESRMKGGKPMKIDDFRK